MAVLKYRDPDDPTGATWLPVSYGGATATNEVTVSATEPTDGSELWLDSDEPASGGGLDQATADDLYVNVTGDAMTGQLGLVAPTLLTNAARWADGVPRFADAAARDAAYASIGGAIAGMRCWLLDLAQEQTWMTGEYFGYTQWYPTGGTLPWISGGAMLRLAPMELTRWTFDVIESIGGTTSPNNYTLRITVAGQYFVSARITASPTPGIDSIVSVGYGSPAARFARLNEASVLGGGNAVVSGGIPGLLDAGDYSLWVDTNTPRDTDDAFLYIAYTGPA